MKPLELGRKSGGVALKMESLVTALGLRLEGSAGFKLVTVADRFFRNQKLTITEFGEDST